MGAVAKTAIVSNGSQRMIGVLQHRFCLPEPIVLNVNEGRAVKKLLKVANVGGTGHTGYGIKCLQFDFFTVVCVDVFYRFEKIEQIPLSVLVGGFFIFDHIADFCDHIQRQMFFLLLGVMFLLFFKGGQLMKDSG